MGTNLRRRFDIGAPSILRLTEYTRHPVIPVASGTYGFLGRSRNSVIITYFRKFPHPLFADGGLSLTTPTTRKLLVALGLHLVLAQPLLTIRLGEFHC